LLRFSFNTNYSQSSDLLVGEIVEATEFLKRMAAVCEKHKLPNQPHVRTYRLLYEHWQSEVPSLLRDRYEIELEEMMMDKFPHIYPRTP
jgi:hypothetical protein